MIEADFSEIERLPIDEPNKRRIRITLQCPDAALIPRVAGAGTVVDGRRGRYQLMHNGLKVVEHGYIGVWVTELIRLMQGLHEPQEEWAFSQILGHIPANAIMIELGSWWAYYSMWFHKQIKNAHNYMIEPDPNNLEVGARNFALNRMTGYHINAAIGRESKDSVLYRCIESDDIERPIRVVSVDDFIAAEQIPSVDLLLADIQGAEVDMLLGAEQSIKKGLIRFVVLSTHHHGISGDPLTHQKCMEFLLGHDAHILATHTISESYSGDGLIVASLSPLDRQLPGIPLSRNAANNGLFEELEYDLARAWDARRQLDSDLKARVEQARINEAALQARETERQQLAAALETTQAERRGLAAALEAAQAENQGLRTATLAAQSERQRLELEVEVRRRADAERFELEYQNRRRYEAELESRLQVLEGEVTSLRVESHRRQLETDLWWREADRHWTALQAIYASYSWRLTAPLRALHIREAFNRPVFAAYRLLNRSGLVRPLFELLRSRSPRLWSALATRLGPSISEPPAADPGGLAVPDTLQSDEDVRHFVGLFERLLAQRTRQHGGEPK